VTRTSFDHKIYDLLGSLPTEALTLELYRAAQEGADPLAFSSGGGRWGFPPSDPAPTSILYTSETKDGAVAEVVSYYRLLSPPPSKPLHVHRLVVELKRVVSLDMPMLVRLGVDPANYDGRPYLKAPARTQEIGATANFLGFDGLRAPSARHAVANIMIMADNFDLTSRLEVVESEEVDWRSWADLHP